MTDASEQSGPVAGRRLDRLVEELAAPAPAPSGGVAASVTGAVAASLVVMVGRGSPTWADGSGAAIRAGELGERLLALADDDVRAFRGVLQAARASGEAPAALAEALLDAAEPPLAIARAAAEVAELAAAASVHGKGAMRADAAVAALLADAAARAGLLTVDANLGGAEASDRAREIAAEAAEVRARLDARA